MGAASCAGGGGSCPCAGGAAAVRRRASGTPGWRSSESARSSSISIDDIRADSVPRPGRMWKSRREDGFLSPPVETAIERQDSRDSAPIHHGDVHGVARRVRRDREQDFPGPERIAEDDGKHLVHHVEQRRKRRMNGVRAADRRVAVQDFQKHLDARHQPFAGHRETFQRPPGLVPVGMGAPDQLHRDVGVHEGHSAVRPASISASICSMSPVGKE